MNQKLIDVIDTLLLASYRTHQGHFGEALNLGWIVCESVIDQLWTSKIVQSTDNPRRKKLKGSDYSASIKVEILEMTGHILKETYFRLEEIRRQRNKWIHELSDVNNETARMAVDTATRFVNEIFVLDLIRLDYCFGGGGGEYMNVIKRRYPSIKLR